MRQSGQGKLPHQIAKDNDGGAEKSDQFVKETAGHMIPNPDGEEKKQDGSAGDHPVADIDQVGRSELPRGLDHFERDGIDERIERGLEKIGELVLGDFFSCRLELPNRKRANVLRGKSISHGELAGDLSLIHRRGA